MKFCLVGWLKGPIGKKVFVLILEYNFIRCLIIDNFGIKFYASFLVIYLDEYYSIVYIRIN